MSSNWSLAFVECSVVNLAEKKIEKGPINLRWKCKNDRRKNFLTQRFAPQTCAIDKRKAILTARPTKVSTNDKKTRSKPNNEKKTFPKKLLQKIILDTWLAVLTKLLTVFWKKPWFSRSRYANDKRNKQSFDRTVLCPQIDPWTRRMQCRQLGWKYFEQRPINLRSISEKDERKKFLHKEFHHNLVQLTNRMQYWQPNRQKLVQMTKKTRSKPNDE